MVRLLATGSEYAFAKIFERYHGRIYAAAFRILKSREFAEEVVQEVFLKVWSRRIAFADVKNLEAFLVTCGRNLTIELFRRRNREVERAYKYASRQQSSENTTESVIIEGELEQLLQQAISRLTPRERTAYELSRVEGLSHRDIAAKLNISANRVNNLIKAATKSIREDLKPHIGFTLIPLLLQILKDF